MGYYLAIERNKVLTHYYKMDEPQKHHAEKKKMLLQGSGS